MKHDCPYCGASLKWRLVLSKPLAGERKFLPNRATAVCPNCHGALAPNNHWSEFFAGAVVGLPMLVLVSYRPTWLKQISVWWFAVIIGIWLLVFTLLHFRYWRRWQRYKRHESNAA